ALEVEPAILARIRHWLARALAVEQVSISDQRQIDAVDRAEIVPQIEASIDLEHVERVVASVADDVDLEDPAQTEAPNDVDAELFEARIARQLDEGALAVYSRKRANFAAAIGPQVRAPVVGESVKRNKVRH